MNIPKKTTLRKKPTSKAPERGAKGAVLANATNLLNATEERKSFIIMNVGRGPLCLTDIAIDLDPGQALDLTHWDPVHVNGSNDLKKALFAKLVLKIDREEYDELMREQFQMDREEESEAARARRRKINVDGKQLDAEINDLNSSEGRVKSAKLSSYGADHDPISYATAYEIAMNDAKAVGTRLSAKMFAEMVDRNPGLVKKLLETGGNSSVSGEPGRGRATVRMPEGQGNTVGKMRLSNLDRDGYLAGGESHNIGTARHRDDLYLDELNYDVDIDDVGEIDSIDLSLDDDDAQDQWEENQKAQVRRRK